MWVSDEKELPEIQGCQIKLEKAIWDCCGSVCSRSKISAHLPGLGQKCHSKMRPHGLSGQMSLRIHMSRQGLAVSLDSVTAARELIEADHGLGAGGRESCSSFGNMYKD